MLRKGMTVREAAECWVDGFDAIQFGMIRKLYKYDPDDWYEVTTPRIYDRVYVYEEQSEGEIIKVNGSGKFKVKLDGGRNVWVKDADDFEVVNDDLFPMWGTMWSFHDPCDNHWVEDEDGIRVLSECGFRVYKSEEFGMFFGIDGVGFDFYESFWIPLYRARGLQWHDPDTEKKKVSA